METKDCIEIESQTETLYSEEEFDALLASTYAVFLQQGEEHDACIEESLHLLCCKAKEDMDANSHTKLLYMEAKKYASEGNRNASTYCAMRMKAIQDLYRGKKKKPAFLTLNKLDFTNKQDAFIKEETAFIEDFLKDMYKKLFHIACFMFVLLMGFLIFILQIAPIYAAIEALFLSSLAYVINKLRMPKIFERKQLDVLAKHVDQDLIELDAPIRFSL